MREYEIFKYIYISIHSGVRRILQWGRGLKMDLPSDILELETPFQIFKYCFHLRFIRSYIL